MSRWGRRFAGILIWLALVVPVGVVVTTKIGGEPTHWSGTRLTDVNVPLLTSHPAAAPEPANILLSNANRQDDSDTGDLAPSYWDAKAGQVVLGAVTDRGVATRQSLGQSAGVPFRVERRAHSSRELRQVLDDVIPRNGAFMSSVDAEHNRVLLTVTRLSPSLFADLAAKYGDAVAVADDPFHPLTYPDGPPAGTVAPSWWSRADPLVTWFTLTTGFPWYLGGALLFAILVWVVTRLGRLDNQPPRTPALSAAAAPSPPPTSTPAPAPSPPPAPDPSPPPDTDRPT
jgi:hypothetical protein